MSITAQKDWKRGRVEDKLTLAVRIRLKFELQKVLVLVFN